MPIGAESYEELEGRCKRIREILDTSDSFKSDTPTNSSGGGEGGIPGRRGGGGGGMFSSSSASQEGKVFVAFTLKEVRQCSHTVIAISGELPCSEHGGVGWYIT